MPPLFYDADLGVYRYEPSALSALKRWCPWVMAMSLSGFPSLLAAAGVLGFALLELTLP
jgi:hypothetical protein